jgi:hypothetical protein
MTPGEKTIVLGDKRESSRSTSSNGSPLDSQELNFIASWPVRALTAVVLLITPNVGERLESTLPDFTSWLFLQLAVN